MRLTIGIICALVLTVMASAQEHITAGTWNFDGTANFAIYSGDLYGNRTLLEISPSATYFLSKGFGLGVNLGLGRSSYNSSDSYGYKSSATYFEIGPKVSYFIDNGSLAVPFMCLEYNMAEYSYHNEYGDSIYYDSYDDGYKLNKIIFVGGIALFINQNIAIMPQINYSIHTMKEDSIEVDGNVLTIGVGIGTFLGKNNNNNNW